jgi:O-6-methylguanine DNA methyltransferase
MSSGSLIDDLEALRTAAPPTVLPAVLVRTGLADGYVTRQGLIGRVRVAFNQRGISACEPADEEYDAAGFERRFLEHFGRPAVPVSEMPSRLAGHLDRALATGRIGQLPIDLTGTGDFQRAVLEKAAEIGPGEIRPYSWIAREIGKPRAVRAVGTALGRNPIPILIPCHRVVRTDGRIGNYGFGPAMKRSLLSAEGVDPDQIEALASRGVRYVGSDTTHVYCHPTCRDARRVTAAHWVAFRSAREAAEAGYRPCRHCRPEPAAA